MGSEQFYLGGQIIRLSGDDTLDESLITHGATFPAGSSVNSDVQLDWYRFGYRHAFELLSDRSTTVSPGVGGTMLDFNYNLDTSGLGPSESRSYVKVTPQMGLNVEWNPNHKLTFSLELDLLGSPVVTSSIPGIFIEDCWQSTVS